MTNDGVSSNIERRFDHFEDEYLKFNSIENPLHPRADICAFLMLHSLDLTNPYDIINGAHHDIIYLSFDEDRLNSVPDEFIRDLRRCGVSYNEHEGLYMYV